MTVRIEMSSSNPIAVIKFGGEVVGSPGLGEVLDDVRHLLDRGWRMLLCHGGGPQTTALSERLGLQTTKVLGQRVTDGATLTAACQAIAGEVGTVVVAQAWRHGIRAMGVSAGVIHARRRPPVTVEGEPGLIDYGLVGDITRLELDLLRSCWEQGYTPVLNPIGVGEGPEPLLNINGDTAASALARELGAAHLFAVTSVPGVLRDRHDPQTRIPRLDPAGVREAIADGTIQGGMIPKVEAALTALEGARAVHILSPEAGAIVAAADEPGCRGTVFLPGA